MAVKSVLFEYWKRHEITVGKTLSIAEVARETGLERNTVKKWLRNEATRYDQSAAEALCKFFDVPAGPVPFIVYEPE